MTEQSSAFTRLSATHKCTRINPDFTTIKKPFFYNRQMSCTADSIGRVSIDSIRDYSSIKESQRSFVVD